MAMQLKLKYLVRPEFVVGIYELFQQYNVQYIAASAYVWRSNITLRGRAVPWEDRAPHEGPELASLAKETACTPPGHPQLSIIKNGGVSGERIFFFSVFAEA